MTPANTPATPTNLLVGQRKAAAVANLIDLRPDDAFAETLIYGVATKTENEFTRIWPVDATIAGNFMGFKTMKLKDGEQEPQSYIKIETLDGKKVRAYAPGQLLSRVQNLQIGQYFEATYRGKEEALIDGVKRNVHKFDMAAEKLANH